MTSTAYRPPRLYFAVGISLILHGGLFILLSQVSFGAVPEIQEQITRISLLPPAIQETVTSIPLGTSQETLPDLGEIKVQEVPSELPKETSVPEIPVEGVVKPAEVAETAVSEKPVVKAPPEEPVIPEDVQAVHEESPNEESSLPVSPVTPAVEPSRGDSSNIPAAPLAGESLGSNERVESDLSSGSNLVSLDSLTPRGSLAVPGYPSRAKRLGYQGRVVLELTISDRGRVTGVEVIRESTDAPEMLIESCRTTVLRRWRFHPPGEEVVTRKTFRFRLNS